MDFPTISIDKAGGLWDNTFVGLVNAAYAISATAQSTARARDTTMADNKVSKGAPVVNSAADKGAANAAVVNAAAALAAIGNGNDTAPVVNSAPAVENPFTAAMAARSADNGRKGRNKDGLSPAGTARGDAMRLVAAAPGGATMKDIENGLAHLIAHCGRRYAATTHYNDISKDGVIAGLIVKDDSARPYMFRATPKLLAAIAAMDAAAVKPPDTPAT